MSDPESKSRSYAQILKSSSIIGGAQGVNYLIGMIKVKLVAMLLGPTGVGLIGLYQSATGLVGTLAGLGIGSSGVREIAEAMGTGDQLKAARMVRVLRRACWVTGFLGWALTAIFAVPLSQWVFGSSERAGAIAVLGVTLLVGAISSGQSALIQGARRIGDLARFSVISVIAGTIVSVGIYYNWGEKGIVPVFIVTALVNLGFSWWFARKIHVSHVELSWLETWQNSKRLLGLGVAFMWSGLMGAGVALVTRALIVRNLGLDANGIYQAAWGISGMFAGFILSAMGADFYPRLTAVSSDHSAVNQLVNEQTEIGILLALPGLLGTLAFAPWIMVLFYSSEFVSGASLLPVVVLGIFGRIISWPMGFILLAKGSSKWYIFSETCANVVHVALIVILLPIFGLWGIALALPLMYAFYTVLMCTITHRLTGFVWNRSVSTLLLTAAALVVAGFIAQEFLQGAIALAVGFAITVFASLFSLRGVAARLGHEHRAIKLALRIPGMRLVCGV